MEMYKYIIDIILPFLTKLFDEIFESCKFPDECDLSIIAPLNKKCPLNDPNNFRDVSLMDSLCKIFINVLSIRLIKRCDDLNVIDEAQAGFRKKYSTFDNEFTLMSFGQK